ncbi:MAG: DUF1588 domain-containing protein [Sandaracinus sp.]|nr:DUF1588 domain-containing protein [Sandaracinus sp.]
MTVGCREGGEPAGPRENIPPRSFDAAGYYAAECAFCHGGAGQGRRGPALAPWAGSRDELIASIDETMPYSDPTDCTGHCAEAVADHVLTLTGELDCSAPPSAPRRLRLLTRREHAATVRDLFAPLTGGSTMPSADPCTDGTTFRFTPSRAVSSVSVAGSFNGWDAGAWPMRDEGGVWTLTRVVPEGTYEYKFVLDGSEWVPDPSATATTPDGFGGVNSVVVVRCGGAGPGVGVTIPDPTTGLPPETRPEAYPFDLQADDGIVTLVHATEYLSAAKRVADALGDSVAQLVPGSDRPGFVRTFGRRAFRRPLSDAEVGRYVELANLESDENAARRLIVRGLLASPVFLYRSEVGVLDGRQYRLDGYEMASALSYGLLGTTPPDALLDAAARGELDSDEGVRRTAESLLADPRARDTLRVFARQWLGLDAIGELSRETSLATRQKLREATERFVAGVLLDGGSFEDLLTARAIPADGEVAAHYGVSAPSTPWSDVELPSERHAGVLGHASVQLRYAHSDQTSPIARGVFVRRRLLCQEFAPPPPDAGGVPDVDPSATTRERFRQHTENERCASCHQYIDDLGFAFEGFDQEGHVRSEERGLPIDTSGTLRDVNGFGTRTDDSLAGIADLGVALSQSRAAQDCFATQWWRWAHGAPEKEAEECLVRDVASEFRRSDRDLRGLLVDVLASPRFRVRGEAMEVMP